MYRSTGSTAGSTVERVEVLVTELVGGEVTGVRVAVLGAAFTPDPDEVRDMSALRVADMLHDLGATVRVYDPAAPHNPCHTFPHLRYFPHLQYGENTLGTVRGADVVVLLAGWAEFRQIDPRVLGGVVRRRRMVDARHALDPAAWRAAGWEYRAPATADHRWLLTTGG